MILHLLRHAEAEEVSPSGRDSDRRLTESGVKRMTQVAKAIAVLDPGYSHVLVSPYVRALETAEPVAEASHFAGKPTETRALLPGADPAEILEELARLAPKAALLVGHEPHMGRLFGRLAMGRVGPAVPMKKAALAIFETGPDPGAGPGELKGYLTPKLLLRLS